MLGVSTIVYRTKTDKHLCCDTHGVHVHFTILNETRFVANNPLHLLIAQSDVNVILLQFNKQLLRTHVPST